ncbi:MAG: DUF2892 domain-containing protein [Gammaproteobacteria bacterium]|nr:DUF2892 domain-containing protein [Gammaproteobacteria bacterium]
MDLNFIKNCNLDKSERMNRIVIGIILFLAALIGFGKVFFMLVGVVMVVQGVIGWCGIPIILEKLNLNKLL